MIRECCWCGENFVANRKDKQVCSPACSQKYSSYKAYKKIREVKGKVIKCEDKGELRKCSRCKDWKRREEDYRTINGRKLMYCKLCQNESKRQTAVTMAGGLPDTPDKLFEEVGKFIMEIKDNNYWVDYVDVFRLVDIFDKIWPTLQKLPSAGGDVSYNAEKSAIIMFDRVARWWVLQKKIRAGEEDV
jgi:hypothetical protein